MWKWEHRQDEVHDTDPSVRGMRPIGFQRYPAMLYKVTKNNPWTFDEHVVQSEMEERNMLSRGFVAGGQAEAVKAYEAEQQGLAIAAAERNYADRNMGEKAQAERDAVEQESSRHLGEIPRTPIKRHRRTKAEMLAAKG
jgi:hypothetical protein